MADEKTICFDYSHKNKLVIESSSYNDFTNYLFSSSFRIGQIKQGITLEKLKRYDMFIIGNAYDSFFELEEIDAIEKYVKGGGGLFIISDSGGDFENEVNLSELTEKFGFRFNADTLFDSMSYQNKQDKPIITNIEPHKVTKDVEHFVYASGSTLWVDKTIEADENITLSVLAKSGLNAFVQTYNGDEYEEKDLPKAPILVAINYYKGRVVALGNLSIFSSLSSIYGYNALDNNILISNIINWLIEAGNDEDSGVDTKLISIPLVHSLSLWLDKLVQDKKWSRVSDVINFSIKFFKDNYNEIMERTEERRKKLLEERARREKERKEQLAAMESAMNVEMKGSPEDAEEELIDLVETRTNEEADALDDILGELAKFTTDEDEEDN